MYDTSIIDWKSLTETQLRNHVRDFAGTAFAMAAMAELQRRGLSIK